ncbi:ABC transporter permease subunit [Candidatus Marsarchaeota archaeon]|nr:ABC transporter permease subunit [Candidatus Marsarchaeota archaeon]MCL5404806.1 ABC transporter permease subunit [Candidatus Marsarchaeota archaeon]
MNKALVIAIKDMKEVFSSPSIYGPMLGVPIFFSIALPFLTVYVALHAAPSIAAKIAITPIVASAASIKSLSFMYFFAINVLGPIFLTIPIFTASVIAADSFAGEKERKTSENLLASPISNGELLLGKVSASFIPTILLTLAVFGIYGGTVNMLSMSEFGEYILPTPTWLMMLASAPFLALAAIAIVVFVSAHVKGIKESQQISTLLVLPILLIPFISILGIANLDVAFFAYVIIALAVVDALILYISVRSFRKEKILY